MMTEEEFMDIRQMHADGMTSTEIAEVTGYHRATISKWFRTGGPPPKRAADPARVVMTEAWGARIAELLVAQPALLSTSIHEIIVTEGFTGAYPTTVRAVRELRGPRFIAAKAASVPIETAPGLEAQFDFADLRKVAEGWGWTVPLFCFGMILSWSRWRMWWFTTSQDREHTFEGVARFFDAIGGVPRIGRTDRMGALGTSQGRRFTLHPPTVAFARHHDVQIVPCQAGDAKRKGKVERPFRQLREAFLTEQDLDPPTSLGQLNERAQVWLEQRVHAVANRTTGVAPADRLVTERQLLQPLPGVRFDTAYREPRTVDRSIPLIHWRGVRYSVPTAALGQVVEVRHPVDSPTFDVRWAGRMIATHTQAEAGSDDVWDPAHHAEAIASALTSTTSRRHLHPVPDPVEPEVAPVRLDIGDGYDIEPPDLTVYGTGCSCTGRVSS